MASTRPILGVVAAEAGIAVAARCDRAGDNPLALFITQDRRAKFFDHSDGFVADVRPLATGYSPFRMWTSVPHIVVVVTRIRASSGPGCGIGLSSRTMRPGSTKSAAFIFGVHRRLLLVGSQFGNVARSERRSGRLRVAEHLWQRSAAWRPTNSKIVDQHPGLDAAYE